MDVNRKTLGIRNFAYNCVRWKYFIYMSIIFILMLICSKILAPTKSDKSSKRKTHPPDNGIIYHHRGYWSGDAAAEYHNNRFSKKLSDRLLKFFQAEKASSVADLGGGGGQYSQVLLENGIFTSCYDGNPLAQDASNGICASIDLTKPMNMAPHEWVLSLSVGRQIPPFYEEVFVSNIHHMNTRGIVIYWGDGQPENSPTHPKTIRSSTQVIDKFLPLGYSTDIKAQKYLCKDTDEDGYSIVVLRRINSTIKHAFSFRKPIQIPIPKSINIAITSCGAERMEEALTLVKSAIIFTQHTQLKIYMFVDRVSISTYEKELQVLKENSSTFNGNKFNYTVLPAEFPPATLGMIPWEKMFKSCSLQRIFLPTLLPEEDAVIYLDADSLILANLTDFWSYFYTATNESTIILASASTEFPKKSWFQKHPEFPHYGERGLNTGITLMNLTRMRAVNFQDLISQVREKYEALRPSESGDQYLQNILYSIYPEFVGIFPCDWNLRRLHCNCAFDFLCGCKSALENGAAILHGTANAFTHDTRLPMYKEAFKVFKKHNLRTDDLMKLIKRLHAQFTAKVGSNETCFFQSPSQLYRRMEEYAKNIDVN